MKPIVVVGAGVVGLCCAYSLRRRGFDVVVIDRSSPGGATSHGNGGWVSPGFSCPVPEPEVRKTSLRWLLRPDSPLYIRLHPDPAFLRWLWAFWTRCNERDYQAGLDALARLNTHTMELYDAMVADGVDFEMYSQGLLFLCRTAAAANKIAGDLGHMERHGYPPVRRMSPTEMREDGVPVSDDVTVGVLAPDERHVRPETLTAGLAGRLTEMGVEVRAGQGAMGFAWRNGRVTGVRTTGDELAASYVVLATGVWTARLGRMLGMRIPLEAGKGYSVTMSPAPISVARPLYCVEDHVGISPYAGALRALGTMELSGLNTNLMRRRVDKLKTAPLRYLDGWSVENVREEWTGMRPMAPDGLPIIGPASTADNVIFAAGHAMLGITLAPATGEAVADIIVGSPDRALLAPFRADRFA